MFKRDCYRCWKAFLVVGFKGEDRTFKVGIILNERMFDMDVKGKRGQMISGKGR